MASYVYEYTNSKFKHPAKTPMTEKEFKLVRKDFDSFMEGILSKAESQYKKMANPFGFKLKWFLILLAIGILLVIAEYMLYEADYIDAGEIVGLISFAPFLAILIQPILWVWFVWRAPYHDFKYNATTYYTFHHSKAEEADNYKNYLTIIKKTNIGEYPGE